VNASSNLKYAIIWQKRMCCKSTKFKLATLIHFLTSFAHFTCPSLISTAYLYQPWNKYKKYIRNFDVVLTLHWAYMKMIKNFPEYHCSSLWVNKIVSMIFFQKWMLYLKFVKMETGIMSFHNRQLFLIFSVRESPWMELFYFIQ
jgi:hypothetical protein